MNKELPMYGGAGLSIAGTNAHPVNTPDVSSKATNQALQNGQSAVQSAMDTYIGIRDFGTGQEQERRLRELVDANDTETKRRLALAPGHPESLYTRNGFLNDTVMENMIYATRKKIHELPGEYLDPMRKIQAEDTRKNVAENLTLRTRGLIEQRQIQAGRQAFEDNYTLAQQQNDYVGMTDAVNGAVSAGVITPTRGNIMRYDGEQKFLSKQIEELIAKDPTQAFNALEDGTFAGLDPTTQIRYKKQIESSLGGAQKLLPMTPEERDIVARGGSVRPKYAARPGATKIEREAADYKNQKGYIPDGMKLKLNAECHNALRLFDENSTEADVKDYAKYWSSYEMDYNVLTLMATDKLDDIKGKTDVSHSLNLDAFVASLPNSVFADANNKEKLSEAKTMVANKLRESFVVWKSTHPKSNYGQQITQASVFASRIIREFEKSKKNTKEADDAKTIEAQMDSVDLRTPEFKDSEKYKEELKKDKRGYLETSASKEGEKPVRKKSGLALEPVKPVPGKNIGIYLSKNKFDAVVKEFGENAVVEIELTEGKKSFLRTQVLGWYEGEDDGVHMTTAARAELGRFEPGRTVFQYFSTNEKKDGWIKPHKEASYDTPNIDDLISEDEGLLPEEAVMASDLPNPLLPEIN